MIKVGDTLPSATLQEYSEVEGEGWVRSNPFEVRFSQLRTSSATSSAP